MSMQLDSGEGEETTHLAATKSRQRRWLMRHRKTVGKASDLREEAAEAQDAAMSRTNCIYKKETALKLRHGRQQRQAPTCSTMHLAKTPQQQIVGKTHAVNGSRSSCMRSRAQSLLQNLRCWKRGKAPAESKPLSLSISGFKVLLKLEIRPRPMPKQMNRIDSWRWCSHLLHRNLSSLGSCRWRISWWKLRIFFVCQLQGPPAPCSC